MGNFRQFRNIRKEKELKVTIENAYGSIRQIKNSFLHGVNVVSL